MENKRMNTPNTLWEFLNSKVGLLVLGFTLSTIIGGIFVNWIGQKTWEQQIAVEQKRQDFEWERSRKFEMLKFKLDEGQKSLEEARGQISADYQDYLDKRWISELRKKYRVKVNRKLLSKID